MDYYSKYQKYKQKYLDLKKNYDQSGTGAGDASGASSTPKVVSECHKSIMTPDANLLKKIGECNNPADLCTMKFDRLYEVYDKNGNKVNLIKYKGIDLENKNDSTITYVLGKNVNKDTLQSIKDSKVKYNINDHYFFEMVTMLKKLKFTDDMEKNEDSKVCGFVPVPYDQLKIDQKYNIRYKNNEKLTLNIIIKKIKCLKVTYLNQDKVEIKAPIENFVFYNEHIKKNDSIKCLKKLS